MASELARQLPTRIRFPFPSEQKLNVVKTSLSS